MILSGKTMICERGDRMTTSIVILTFNQLPLTDKCLQSIRQHTEDYELIVVDNGSTDGTVAYLRNQPDVIVHENGQNLGFAKGCNQGIELSTGENILFLNNDTIVTEHWLGNMLRVLEEHERVGMVGPVTNYSSGHQQIPVTYSDLSGLEPFARVHCEEHADCYTDVRRLVGFCLLAKRKVLDEIGYFDERYGLGNYEDDDLCLRALRAGYMLRVVHDSYIHHIGHATMNQLEEYNLSILLHTNRLKAVEKWGADIHQLIYRPAITVSLCMVTENAEATLRQSLAPILDDIDEIVVIDKGSSDLTVTIAGYYTSHVYSLANESDYTDPFKLAFERATEQYVLWLEQADILSSEAIRKLCSLKLSIEGNEDLVPLQGERQVLLRRAAGFRLPDEWR